MEGTVMHVILIAEDDKPIRDLLSDALAEHDDWKVAEVADGVQLLEALTDVLPDLIILDVTMPRLDGIQGYHLLQHIGKTKEIPVLFLTATPEKVWKAHLPGHFECLAKPFELGTLLETAARLMGVAS
jgi:two-component system chemotaxis response regulator CheY